MHASMCRVLMIAAVSAAIVSSTTEFEHAEKCTSLPEKLQQGGEHSAHPQEGDDALSLFQGGMSVTKCPVGKYVDARTSGDAAQSSSSDRPAFYLSVCLDILIIAIVANGVKRYRNGDHLRARNTVEARPKEPLLFNERVAALHAAAREGNVERCTEVLEDGASAANAPKALVDQEDFWGCTALHIAADNGSVPVTSLLLKHGAKVRGPDDIPWESTPLHFAARAGSFAVCQLLLTAGALVNALDVDGCTPLQIASLQGHESTCELLLDKGGILNDMFDDDVPPVLTGLFLKRLMEPVKASSDA